MLDFNNLRGGLYNKKTHKSRFTPTHFHSTFTIGTMSGHFDVNNGRLCWWQFWGVGDLFELFMTDSLHWQITNTKEKNRQHDHSATNILQLSPLLSHHCHHGIRVYPFQIWGQDQTKIYFSGFANMFKDGDEKSSDGASFF